MKNNRQSKLDKAWKEYDVAQYVAEKALKDAELMAVWARSVIYDLFAPAEEKERACMLQALAIENSHNAISQFQAYGILYRSLRDNNE